MSLIGVSLAAPTIAGLGTALTVIGGAVWVWPFGLTLDRVELGASSLPATFGALGPGVILILVVGVLSMIVGSWAAYTTQPAGVGSHGSHGERRPARCGSGRVCAWPSPVWWVW